MGCALHVATLCLDVTLTCTQNRTLKKSKLARWVTKEREKHEGFNWKDHWFQRIIRARLWDSTSTMRLWKDVCILALTSRVGREAEPQPWGPNEDGSPDAEGVRMLGTKGEGSSVQCLRAPKGWFG